MPSRFDEPADAARAVLAFWFDEVGRDRWFVKDAAVDSAISARFGGLRDHVLANRAAGWRDQPECLLAAIILLDQFSRNIHRGSRKAFEADPLARELAMIALDRGWAEQLAPHFRQFLLMPLMHSEKLPDQSRSIAEVADLGDPSVSDFAQRHPEQIVRFGRFPGRNSALGRRSSAAELALIESGETF